MRKMKPNSCPGLGRGTNAQMILALKEAMGIIKGVNNDTHEGISLFDETERTRIKEAVHALAMDIVGQVELSYEPEEKLYDVLIDSTHSKYYTVSAEDEEDAAEKAMKISREQTGDLCEAVEVKEHK